jgi:hypothetical protein
MGLCQIKSEGEFPAAENDCPEKDRCGCIDRWCGAGCFEKSLHHCFVQKREVSDK